MDDSLPRIEAIAAETLDTLPTPFRSHISSVILQVSEWPDDSILLELGIEDPLVLTGLYQGTPLTEKSVSDPDTFPDMIYLYRQPILAELAERPGTMLEELVRHVTIHEIAHHFGWSDEDIAEIDQWWE